MGEYLKDLYAQCKELEHKKAEVDKKLEKINAKIDKIRNSVGGDFRESHQKPDYLRLLPLGDVKLYFSFEYEGWGSYNFRLSSADGDLIPFLERGISIDSRRSLSSVSEEFDEKFKDLSVSTIAVKILENHIMRHCDKNIDFETYQSLAEECFDIAAKCVAAMEDYELFNLYAEAAQTEEESSNINSKILELKWKAKDLYIEDMYGTTKKEPVVGKQYFLLDSKLNDKIGFVQVVSIDKSGLGCHCFDEEAEKHYYHVNPKRLSYDMRKFEFDC